MNTPLSPDLARLVTGYLVDRRDKRRITALVLALYAAALLYHFVAGAFGAPEQRAALASIETLALVVVVAHIAGGVAQRHVAAKISAAPESGSAP
jgi:nitrate/nitrite transporter NarK